MAASGLPLAKSQTLLLEKIEELTLYMIELKQQNDDLQTVVEDLRGNK